MAKYNFFNSTTGQTQSVDAGSAQEAVDTYSGGMGEATYKDEDSGTVSTDEGENVNFSKDTSTQDTLKSGINQVANAFTSHL